MARKELSFLLDGIYCGSTKKMGRGMYTKGPLKAGTLIEIAPVIVMAREDRRQLDITLLHDYIFEWGGDKDQCAMALGFVALYNHSYEANCEYEMYYAKELMAVKTVTDIKAGAELFINYNGDWNNKMPVWFDADLPK